MTQIHSHEKANIDKYKAILATKLAILGRRVRPRPLKDGFRAPLPFHTFKSSNHAIAEKQWDKQGQDNHIMMILMTNMLITKGMMTKMMIK